MRTFRKIPVAPALAMVVAGWAGATPVYNFTSFNGPGNNGGGTTVNGINNNGYVVGFSSDNPAAPTLFTNFIRNPNGSFTTLAIGGDPLAMANGINNSLTVVGGLSNGRAFTLVGGLLLPLSAVNSTTASQTAFGVSDQGLIVGQFVDNATGTTPGYLLQNGAYTVLNPLSNGIITNAQGVNNSGLVAGFASTDGVHQHGFLFNSVSNNFTFVSDPNVPNLVLTQFLGINDQGIVAGYYQLSDGSQHGFLYNSGTQSYTFLDDPYAAHTGVSITQITGINDSGEIAGFYVDAQSGVQRGFIATAATPEPGSYGVLIGSVLFLLYFQTSRKRRGRRD